MIAVSLEMSDEPDKFGLNLETTTEGVDDDDTPF